MSNNEAINWTSELAKIDAISTLVAAARRLEGYVVGLSEQSDSNALDMLNIVRRGHCLELDMVRAALVAFREVQPSS